MPDFREILFKYITSLSLLDPKGEERKKKKKF